MYKFFIIFVFMGLLFSKAEFALAAQTNSGGISVQNESAIKELLKKVMNAKHVAASFNEDAIVSLVQQAAKKRKAAVSLKFKKIKNVEIRLLGFWITDNNFAPLLDSACASLKPTQWSCITPELKAYFERKIVSEHFSVKSIGASSKQKGNTQCPSFNCSSSKVKKHTSKSWVPQSYALNEQPKVSQVFAPRKEIELLRIEPIAMHPQPVPMVVAEIPAPRINRLILDLAPLIKRLGKQYAEQRVELSDKMMFGIPKEKRFAIFIDSSESLFSEYIDADTGKKKKYISYATKQIIDLLKVLAPDQRFQIIFYGDQIRGFKGTDVPATASNIQSAIQFLSSFDAHRLGDDERLSQAVQIAKAASANPLERLYVLTDFAYDETEIMSDEWMRKQGASIPITAKPMGSVKEDAIPRILNNPKDVILDRKFVNVSEEEMTAYVEFQKQYYAIQDVQKDLKKINYDSSLLTPEMKTALLLKIENILQSLSSKRALFIRQGYEVGEFEIKAVGLKESILAI